MKAPMTLSAESFTLLALTLVTLAVMAACATHLSETVAAQVTRLPEPLQPSERIPLHAGLYLTESFRAQTYQHQLFRNRLYTITSNLGEALSAGTERMLTGLFQDLSILSEFDADLEKQGIDVVIRPTVKEIGTDYGSHGIGEPARYWTTIRWDIVSPDGTIVYFATFTGESADDPPLFITRTYARFQAKMIALSVKDSFAKAREDLYGNPWWKDPWWKDDERALQTP